MQGKISMDLSFCQSENGFSLDELIIKLADAYERKAFSELLKMILQLVQEILHGSARKGDLKVVIGVGNYKCSSRNLGQ